MKLRESLSLVNLLHAVMLMAVCWMQPVVAGPTKSEFGENNQATVLDPELEPDAYKEFEPSIDATVTLAELQETLSKIQEDLEERIVQLDRFDNKEIIRVLKDKKKQITSRLKELDSFAHYVTLYRTKREKPQDNTILWIGWAIALGLVASLTTLACYEPGEGFHLIPTEARTMNNLDLIADKVQRYWPFPEENVDGKKNDIPNAVPVELQPVVRPTEIRITDSKPSIVAIPWVDIKPTQPIPPVLQTPTHTPSIETLGEQKQPVVETKLPAVVAVEPIPVVTVQPVSITPPSPRPVVESPKAPTSNSALARTVPAKNRWDRFKDWCSTKAENANDWIIDRLVGSGEID